MSSDPRGTQTTEHGEHVKVLCTWVCEHSTQFPTPDADTSQTSKHSRFLVSPLTCQGFGPKSSRCRMASVSWPALTLPSGSLCCLALSSSLLSPQSLLFHPSDSLPSPSSTLTHTENSTLFLDPLKAKAVDFTCYTGTVEFHVTLTPNRMKY